MKKLNIKWPKLKLPKLKFPKFKLDFAKMKSKFKAMFPKDANTGKVRIPMPTVRIIDRYIIAKFIGTYLFIIALFVLIIVIFDYAEQVDDFITLKAPFKAIVFDYYVNYVPFLINQFSGLFTFITVIWFTSKMASQTEIIAILSSGVSFRRLMWPYFLSALMISALSLSLSLWVIPNANAKRVQFESKYIQRKHFVNYDMNIYRQLEPGTFVYVRNFTGESQRATFFAMEKYSGTMLVQALDAADAQFNPSTGRWSAPVYTIRTYTPQGNEIYQSRQNLDTLINLNTQELGRVTELIKTMKIGELNTFIHQQKIKGSDMIPVFEVERQSRFSYAIATFILTLIGVSLSSRKVRGGTGFNIGIGIVLCFMYILLSRFAEEFAKGGIMPAQISVWLPNVLFAIVAVYIYKKAPK